MATAASRFTIKLSVVLALIFTAAFVVADEEQIQVEELRSEASDASLRIELDNLHSKTRELEHLIEGKTHELRSKDGAIEEKEKIIHENLDRISLLQSEIASLKDKGKLDTDKRLTTAYTRADELEKQVDDLKKKIEAKDKKAEVLNSQNEEIKTKIQELNSKLEKLQQTVEKQKVQFHKTERALRLAEEELMKAKSEATTRTNELLEVHGAWLPPWIEAQRVYYQTLVGKHWQQHGKPILQNALDKATEKKSQALEWMEPHIITIKTQWIPVAKEQWVVVVESVKPHVHSLNTKTIEIYETTKIALTPHIIKAQEIADPYFKDLKKFSKPYIEQVATFAKPHVEKVQGFLKPYTEKAIQQQWKSKRVLHLFLFVASVSLLLVLYRSLSTTMEVSLIDHELPFYTHNFYNVKFFDRTILTLVTHTPSFVETWISEIEAIHRAQPLQKLIVGLDIEWRPNVSRNQDNPAALLQLCVGDRCLIFQLIHAPSIPSSLFEFFRNLNHTFVGVGIGKDVEKLIKDYGFEVRGSICDLGTLAADRFGDRKLKTAGLKTLSARVLSKEVEKPKEISCSRWDTEWLSAQQVQYACLDAFLSFEIGRILNDSN